MGKNLKGRVHLISQYNSLSFLENAEAQGEKHLLFTQSAENLLQQNFFIKFQKHAPVCHGKPVLALS